MIAEIDMKYLSFGGSDCQEDHYGGACDIWATKRMNYLQKVLHSKLTNLQVSIIFLIYKYVLVSLLETVENQQKSSECFQMCVTLLGLHCTVCRTGGGDSPPPLKKVLYIGMEYSTCRHKWPPQISL